MLPLTDMSPARALSTSLLASILMRSRLRLQPATLSCQVQNSVNSSVPHLGGRTRPEISRVFSCVCVCVCVDAPRGDPALELVLCEPGALTYDMINNQYVNGCRNATRGDALATRAIRRGQWFSAPGGVAFVSGRLGSTLPAAVMGKLPTTLPSADGCVSPLRSVVLSYWTIVTPGVVCNSWNVMYV